MKRIWEKRKRVLARLRPRSSRRSPSASAPPVVLLHGLAVPRLMMSYLGWKLSHKYGRQVINLKMNTRLYDIPDCAELVARQLRDAGIREFDAVTHSAGGVVMRWAMNHRAMPRLRRAVLISPPNNGAWIVMFLRRKIGFLYPLLYGQFGMQLARGDLGLAARAGGLPGTEVGIIAGGAGTPRGIRNFFGIPGDGDGTVAVEETILPGMKDFILLNYDHTMILFSSQTAHMANLFLEHGVFRPRLGVEDATPKSLTTY